MVASSEDNLEDEEDSGDNWQNEDIVVMGERDEKMDNSGKGEVLKEKSFLAKLWNWKFILPISVGGVLLAWWGIKKRNN